MSRTASGGSTASTFVYDALGGTYSRANSGTTTLFYYGPGGILTEKQGGSFTSAYAYGNGLIRKDGEYPMFDGLGSQRTVTNSSQTVTATLTQDGFGNAVASTGSSSNPYKFAATSGYRDDGDAGLSHVGARYYDAQVGRFITTDTELDQHPYLYCEHNPVNLVDPSGHWPDVTGWIGRQLGLDLNFDHDDWNQIRKGMDNWGTGEITVGGALVGYPAVDPKKPPMDTPVFKGKPVPAIGLRHRTLPGPKGGGPKGAIGAIGGGLIIGGTIAKALAWIGDKLWGD